MPWCRRSGRFCSCSSPALRQFVVTLDDRTEYVEHSYNALTNVAFQDNGQRKLLLIGDSFSQDFYNMIRETGAFGNYQIVTRRFLSTCQLYLGDEDISPFLEPADLRDIAAEADVVIFALSWRRWSGERIAETVANFGFRDDQKVFVIGRKNFGYFNLRGFLSMAPKAMLGFRNAPNEEHMNTNAAMKRSVPPAIFVDTQVILCGDHPDCPLFIPTGDLIAFDGNHLTVGVAVSERHPRWTFHFTPTSSSWLNAVEGFFAKLSRRRLKHGVFHSLVDLQAAINRFIAEHNAAGAKPFVWRANSDDIIACDTRRSNHPVAATPDRHPVAQIAS